MSFQHSATCFLSAAHSHVKTKSYQETQESSIPAKKLRNLGLLPGNSKNQYSHFSPGKSGNQNSWKDAQGFPGSQTERGYHVLMFSSTCLDIRAISEKISVEIFTSQQS